MGIWVVTLEAVDMGGERDRLLEPDDLEALADEMAGQYPVVTTRPGAYQAELWVEEGTAGGAVLFALKLWQTSVRTLGLPLWDVARAEARDARALELGVISWPAAPEEALEAAVEQPVAPPGRTTKRTRKGRRASAGAG